MQHFAFTQKSCFPKTEIDGMILNFKIIFSIDRELFQISKGKLCRVNGLKLRRNLSGRWSRNLLRFIAIARSMHINTQDE